MRIRHALLALCAATVFASASAAQNCSTLAVTGGAPGTDLTFAVSGAPADSATLLIIGDTLGSTVIPTPFGDINLGLAQPFSFFPLGTTDAAGNVSLVIPVPSQVATCLQTNAQALTLEVTIAAGPPTVNFCTSNVDAVSIGSCP